MTIGRDGGRFANNAFTICGLSGYATAATASLAYAQVYTGNFLTRHYSLRYLRLSMTKIFFCRRYAKKHTNG